MPTLLISKVLRNEHLVVKLGFDTYDNELITITSLGSSLKNSPGSLSCLTSVRQFKLPYIWHLHYIHSSFTAEVQGELDSG